VSANGVLSFRGVPYGGPADGAGRFMPPTKPTPWQGVRDAVKAGPRAMQLQDKSFGGGPNIYTSPLLGPYFSGGRKDAAEITVEENSENCLVLNVLTPSLQGKRPVMIYIHGGGFAQGSGALTLLADRFVKEENIVLVGVNHRLNVFGYTYLGDLDPKYANSGNVGQMDLVQSLEWVRDNIAHFGGDPGNVTVFGESGGGAKISCLMAMPSAKGLFRRAIIESGSARSVRTRAAAIEDTKKMLETLKLTPSDVGKLQTVSPDELLTSTRRSSPLVDGLSVPHETWTNGAPPEAAGVPLIVGNDKEEARVFSTGDPGLYSLDWTSLPVRLVKTGIPQDKVDMVISKYRELHPTETASDIYFIISADRGARTNAIRQATAKLQQNSGDVYMYYFAWATPIDNGRLKSFHTAELPLAVRLVLNPEAEGLSKQIAGAWAAFARTGDPNHAGLPRWEKYSVARKATMIFDAGKTALVDKPGEEELALIQSFPVAGPI
jgi:para-nitrobenzyl esterase